MSKGNCGDRIRVVDAETGETYKNGHEGFIVRTKDSWSGAEVRFNDHSNGKAQYLCGYEYDVIENTSQQDDRQEITWEVGQEVWCLLRGKGVVHDFEKNISLWTGGVTVYFENHGTVRYNIDGKVSGGMNRCLYFSEPKIIAEKMPPEKPFVPTLKSGELVVAICKLDGENETFTLGYETREGVESSISDGEVTYAKSAWNFYKVGEQVKFN